ncbi:hypothetical protein NIES37_19160 [Tolypothrix tenuis PCC 7101]|uniref:ATPase AAA-type core domain-containing protein n=1 Tax=Tolypothrix tenuis PCC 7101 TaxID=231146 RepID=A0A1Z4MWZ6_9CYAN|nr:ATP-binding protein [Aulosira sp. FACHB-113]BAY97968.1 hypothetical protein NIES37_19160 [Tolypothrix tenuis PCC 7101]BAZ71525.1 hypothetical protein NIES50_00680 [Aulosira laxa NIES-50]
MRINQLTYYDRKREWRFEPIQFSELNLLVGASGVGKTQILESIINLQKIADGKSLNGVSWNIDFTVDTNLYNWQGEFETGSLVSLILDSQNEKNQFKIVNEFLSVNGKTIIHRNAQEIKFHNQILPKLSSFQSVVAILSEEEDIAPIKYGFSQITDNSDDYSNNSMIFLSFFVNKIFDNYSVLKDKYSSLPLEDIQKSNLLNQIKLGLTYEYFPEVFERIKHHFMEIFVQVEDIKLEQDEELVKSLNPKNYPIVKIKEKGVNNWINQIQISSGMYKTLMYISELYLSAEGTVILIDEFENSLGVNCIDIVTELILENKNLQFIITSHHPYIINKINIEHWKIVTRRGGVVTARDAKEFNLGKSRHQAFMQLINLDAYKEGIAVG